MEAILIKRPAVAQAAVIGVPDPEEQVVRAFIVLKARDALTEAELMAWARDNMAVYKAPREVGSSRRCPPPAQARCCAASSKTEPQRPAHTCSKKS